MTNFFKEMSAKSKVLKLADIEVTPENIAHYENCGYLTVNSGRNGREYVWYVDDNHNIAVDIKTLQELSEREINDYLL